jgi:hypothetical protein
MDNYNYSHFGSYKNVFERDGFATTCSYSAFKLLLLNLLELSASPPDGGKML